MSKSKGNFYTLRDLLAKGYDPMAIRCALLNVHYGQQLNFTLEGLDESVEIIKKLDNCYFQSLSLLFLDIAPRNIDDQAVQSGCWDLATRLPDQVNRIKEALSQDLNVAAALSFLHEAITEINFRRFNVGAGHLQAVCDFFRAVDFLFGLDVASEGTVPSEVIEKLRSIRTYREKKDFGQAGKLRDELAKTGWLVKDGRPGEPSTIKKKRRAWDK